jgi:hypothetical protein
MVTPETPTSVSKRAALTVTPPSCAKAGAANSRVIASVTTSIFSFLNSPPSGCSDGYPLGLRFYAFPGATPSHSLDDAVQYVNTHSDCFRIEGYVRSLPVRVSTGPGHVPGYF